LDITGFASERFFVLKPWNLLLLVLLLTIVVQIGVADVEASVDIPFLFCPTSGRANCIFMKLAGACGDIPWTVEGLSCSETLLETLLP
jgi:hypothetical protein